jgi:hypothetical protein
VSLQTDGEQEGAEDDGLHHSSREVLGWGMVGLLLLWLCRIWKWKTRWLVSNIVGEEQTFQFTYIQRLSQWFITYVRALLSTVALDGHAWELTRRTWRALSRRFLSLHFFFLVHAVGLIS